MRRRQAPASGSQTMSPLGPVDLEVDAQRPNRADVDLERARHVTVVQMGDGARLHQPGRILAVEHEHAPRRASDGAVEHVQVPAGQHVHHAQVVPRRMAPSRLQPHQGGAGLTDRARVQRLAHVRDDGKVRELQVGMNQLRGGAERVQHPFHARPVGGDGRLEQERQA